MGKDAETETIAVRFCKRFGFICLDVEREANEFNEKR